jgi:SOS-response transcriptional repressor LexA
LKKANQTGTPSIGQKIKAARKSAGLTLDSLSQQIGISIQALSAIERGVANPSKQTLIGLARALENDFGEVGLKRYATGTRKLTHSQLVSKVVKERYQRERQEPELNPYLENILEWSFEVREAAKLPRPVQILTQKSALMPIHYEITNGDTLNINDDNYKVVVPYSLIPSIEKARCVRVQDHPIRDAFLSPGDVLVLYERSIPEEGKTVLASVDNNIVVRRWQLDGRKVVFTALDRDYEPIVVSRKNVEFIGELLGVLRFISTFPVPFFK